MLKKRWKLCTIPPHNVKTLMRIVESKDYEVFEMFFFVQKIICFDEDMERFFNYADTKNPAVFDKQITEFINEYGKDSMR